MTNHPPDMVQAVEPSAEEIEAAARAIHKILDERWGIIVCGPVEELAQAAFKAAMAVRRGKALGTIIVYEYP